MKKHRQLILLVAALLLPLAVGAQGLDDYTFSTGTDATKWVTVPSTVTSLITPGVGDYGASAVQNIGFSFPFGDGLYSQYTVNTDGTLRLGPTAVSTSNYSSPFGTTNLQYNLPKICILGADGFLSDSGYVRPLLTTIGGQQVLVVEFATSTYTSTSRPSLLRWQVHLYQNGKLEIVYSSQRPPILPAVTRQCGMALNTGDIWLINAQHQATHYTTAQTTTIASSTWPDVNRYYAFTPSSSSCPRPLLTLTSVDANTASVSINTANDSAGFYAYDWVVTPGGGTPDWTQSSTEYDTVIDLTGLNSNASYDLHVRTSCTDTFSNARVLSFRTPIDCNGDTNIVFTIGTGTSTSSTYLMYSTTSYARGGSWNLFLADELEAIDGLYAGDINSIAFDYSTTSSYPAKMRIFMGHTTKERFASASDTAGLGRGDLQLVYNGRHTFSTGWNEIMLDTTFHYDGSQNLVVLVLRDSAVQGSMSFRYTTTTTGRIIYRYGSTSLTSGSASSYRANMRFNMCSALPTCAPVAWLDVDDVDSTSATFTWSDPVNNGAASYSIHLINQTTGDTTTADYIYDTTYTVTTLTPGTTYRAILMAECSGDTAPRVRMVTFTTTCVEATLPWTESFESYATGSFTNPCWTFYNQYSSGTTVYPTVSTSQHLSGANSMYFYSSGSSYQTIAILPVFDHPVGDLAMTVSLRNATANYGIVVGYVTNFVDPTTFVPVDTLIPTATSTWQEFEVSFPDTATGRIAYRHINGYTCYIDDIMVYVEPSCQRPSGVSVRNIDTVSAEVVIADNLYNGTYRLDISGDSTFSVMGYDTVISLTGLMPDSRYEVAMMAVCTDGTLTAPLTTEFRTLCTPVATTSLPWHEDFESYTGGTSASATSVFNNTCWYVNDRYSDNYPYVSTSQYQDGTKSLYHYASSAHPTISVLPPFEDAVSDLEVSLYVRNATAGYGLVVGYITNPVDSSTFVPVDTLIPTATSTWELFLVQFPPSATGRIAMRNVGGWSCYVDEIDVHLAPSCDRIQGFTVSNIDAHGATININDPSGTYNYVVRLINGADTTDYPTTSTAVTVTGLTQATTYEVEAWSVCSNGNGTLPQTGSFTTDTLCYTVANLQVAAASISSVALTWSYQTTHGMPPAGVSVTLVDNTDTTLNQTLTTSGTYCFFEGLTQGHGYTVRVVTDCGSEYSQPVQLSLPLASCGEEILSLGATGTTFSPIHGSSSYSFNESLYLAGEVTTNTITSIAYEINQGTVPAGRKVVVYMGNTALNELTTSSNVPVSQMTRVTDTVTLGGLTGTGQWLEIPLNAPFQRNGQNLVILIHNVSGTTTSTLYWKGLSTSNRAIYLHSQTATSSINNISWSAVGSTLPNIKFGSVCDTAGCIAPTLLLSGIDQHSAHLSWVAGNGETSWTVEYRPQSDTNWTTVAASTTDTSITINNLAGGTDYIFRVGGLCSDTTAYATVSGFTLCDEYQLPWTENFDSYAAGTFTHPCWDFMNRYSTYPTVSTSQHLSGANSMYFYSSGSSYQTIAVLPSFADSLNTLEMSLSLRNATANYGIVVGYMADPEVESTFTPVDTLIPATTATWEEFIVNFPQEATGRIAFRHINGYICYIDDINVHVAPACDRMQSFAISDIGTNGATITVSDSAMTNNYIVRFINGTDTISVPFSNSSVSVNTLTPATRYSVEVYSVCPNGTTTAPRLGELVTDTLCYGVSNLALAAANITGLAFTWSYQTSHGMPPAGVSVTLVDNTDTTLNQTLTTSGTYCFFSGLTQGHSYTVRVVTDCGSEYSLPVQVSAPLASCGEVTIDATSSGSFSPFYTSNAYSINQNLFLSSEVSTRNISSLSYKVNSSALSAGRKIVVYMGNTTLSSLTASSYVPISQMTRVTDTITLPAVAAGQWFTIQFDSVFHSNGTNIAITIHNVSGSTGSGNWYARSVSNRAIYNHSITATTNINTITSWTTTGWLPAIRFGSICDTTGCMEPTMIVSNIDQTSARLSWVAGSGETSWAVGYMAEDDTAWTSVSTSQTDTSATISNLQPGTLYTFRVGSNCTDGSVEYATVQAYTPCTEYTTPWSEDFESYAAATFNQHCWNFLNRYSTYPTVSTSQYQSGSKSMYFYSSSSSYPTIAVLPAFADSLNTLEMSLSLRNATANYGIVVGYMSDPDVASTFVPVDTLIPAAISTWEQFVVTFPQEATGRIAFRHINGYSCYVDDISVYEAPSCARIQSVVVSNVTATTADLTINDPASVGDYRIVMTANGRTDTLNFNTTSYSLTNLQPSSDYDVNVYTVCADGTTTSPRHLTIQTQCGAISALPWHEGFESWGTGSANVHRCWDHLYESTSSPVHTSYPYVSSSATAAYEGTKYMSFYTYLSSTYGAYYSAAFLPEFADSINSLEMSFHYKANNATYYNSVLVVVGVSDSTADTSTFTPVDTIVAQDNNWNEYTVNFGTYTGTGKYITILMEGTRATYITSYIDNIYVDTFGVCSAPARLNLVSVLDTAVTLSWVDPSGGGTYVVKWGDSDSAIVLNDTSYTINGLLPDHAYTVSVRKLCGTRAREVSFHTACAVLTRADMPYTEDFDSYTSGTSSAISPCWTKYSFNTSYPSHPYPYSSTHHGASGNSMYFITGDMSKAEYLVMPLVDTVNNKVVNFWTYVTTVNYARIDVGVMTNPTDTSTFTVIQTTMPATANTWTEWEVSFAGYTGNGQYIAFREYNGNGTGAYTTYLDDVVLDLIPACQRPAGLSITNLTDNSVSVQISDPSAIGSYRLYWTTGNTTDSANLTDTVYTITGLQANTEYTIGVAARCTDGSLTRTREITAQTLATVVTWLPYTCDFEGSTSEWQTINGTQTNQWHVGTAASNGGTHGLYISDDNGAANTYTNTASIVYASINIQLPADNYSIHFDWRTQGESTFDFMRVWLAPASAVLTAGSYPAGMSAHNDIPTGFIDVSGRPSDSLRLNLHSTWQDSAGVDSIHIAAGVYKLVFMWRNDGSVGNQPPAAIDNVVVRSLNGNVVAPCSAPTITNTTATDATVTVDWTADHDSCYVAITDGQWSDNVQGTLVANGVRTHTFTGLTPNTTYTVGVRQQCGATSLSSWTVSTVTTSDVPCLAVSDLRLVSATFTSVTVGWTPAGQESAWNVRVYSNTFDTTVRATMATATVGGLQRGVAYNVLVQPLCGSAASVEGPWNDTPLSVTTADCDAPSYVSFSDITSSSVKVAWETTGGASAWRIEYGYSGFSRGEGVSVDVQTNPYTLTGLEENTTYDVYVATICGSTDVMSVWSQVASFTTSRGGEGIDGVEADGIALYPNPASGSVTVLTGEAATVSVIDQSGREVRRVESTEGVVSVNLEGMASGAYYVRVVSERATAVRKLIVR